MAKTLNCENVNRNSHLKDEFNITPKLQKTGTTISGVIYEGGVVLGCDTRATSGPIVAVKNTWKIKPIADNIACAGAGTAADCSYVMRKVKSKLQLLKLTSKRENRVTAAKTMFVRHLFPYQGYVSAYLIVGGADSHGSHLYTVSANGATLKSPFTANGSGSLAAISVLEAGYKDGMTVFM